MSKVVIVDYGVGNLLSVCRAFEAIDATPIISSDAKIISSADRLLLPGVGAFGHCMDEIRSRNLISPILEFVQSNRPLLGICVGMQVLHSLGKEFGEHEGLSLIEGVVDNIPASSNPKAVHKIPYVGWAKLTSDHDSSHPLHQHIDNKWMYFVHGFMAIPKDKNHIAAYYNYNDVQVTACTAKDNIIGAQFHPEKSADDGLNFLKYFMGI